MSTRGYAYAHLYRQMQFETEATENGIDYQYRIDGYLRPPNTTVSWLR
ncbi:hypothetical protein PQG02_09095 [Nostoc sp. UHCC 0926]|nr:hypothetical protein [Nostoc sp. UHCC 0926]WDD34459.1 hypothetical protein PQG02_09095 [Nostoc sp. UHCC 0926]